jgi:hypothetical protein
MNRNLSLVLVASAVVCGLALAQAPQSKDAAQVAALQKRVEALEADVAALKKASPGTGEFAAGIDKDRKTVEQLVKYTAAQAAAAVKLQAVLEDSRAKGFTFGINPDSRTVLLQGFQDFTESIKTEALKPEPQPKAGDAKGKAQR